MLARSSPRRIFRSRSIRNLRPLSASNAVHHRQLYTAESFERIISQETSKRFHIFVSGATNPYFNLSLEHYLFEHSHSDSTVLLLYINDPCIVIGRNQNPWLEADLTSLAHSSFTPSGSVPIIRRRSGGGTVFHDHGNINYSVICSVQDFKRDKYAEMVASALRIFNARARVNERHDIVLDMGDKLEKELHPLPNDMHKTAYSPISSLGKGPLKVSGSAYKLSRTRALHHGTCLVASKNIGHISWLLNSSLKSYVTAQGVDSVRSPVGNAWPHLIDQNVSDRFVKSVFDTFVSIHDLLAMQSGVPEFWKGFTRRLSATEIFKKKNCVYGMVQRDLVNYSGKIQSGMAELQSSPWLYGQTPRFTFNTHPTDEDPRPRPQLPPSLPVSTNVTITARGGCINAASISLSPSKIVDSEALIGQEIYRIGSWKNVLRTTQDGNHVALSSDGEIEALGDWLDELFGMRKMQNVSVGHEQDGPAI